MVTSLKFTKALTFNLGKTDKFKCSTNDTVLSIKDIPAIRYNFTEYGDTELGFIRAMLGKFRYSLHVVEFDISSHALDLDKFQEFSNLAYILHIPIYAESVNERTFGQDIEQKMQEHPEFISRMDRFVITDKSDNLDYMTLNALMFRLDKLVHCGLSKIGCCNSPFTTSENSCLSALTTRELSAKYTIESDAVLPSSNHNRLENNCGCLRYITIEQELIPVYKAVSSKETKETKETKDGKRGQESKAKKLPKGVMPMW